jgi:hypothetical protein
VPTPTPTPIPPTPTAIPAIAGYYYPLTPCLPCSTGNEIRYIWYPAAAPSQGPYEPAVNQRFLGNTNECYYTYQPNALYPKLEILDDLTLTLDQRGVLANETGCPVIDTGFNYILQECVTNIYYRFESFRVFSPNTRVSNASGNTYLVIGTNTDKSYPLLTGIECVDDNGNLSSSPKFITCALNCPQEGYYEILKCNAQKSKQITKQSSNELAQRGYNIGDVIFTESNYECYTITGTITDIRGKQKVDFSKSQKLDSCFQCTNSFFEDTNAI